MVERLGQLEQEKKESEYRLTKLELDAQICRVSEDDLKEAFKRARQMLKSGGLSNTKALIERYIHQVVIHPESIEVQLNFGFDVQVDEKAEPPSAVVENYAHGDSASFVPQSDSCGFDGGEGSPRTPTVKSTCLVTNIERCGVRSVVFVQAQPILDIIH